VSEPISITFRDDVQAQVEALSAAEGVPEDEFIQKAVEEYLFLRRFRQLRGEMMADLEARGIRLTDEDVFKMVS
jgi:hypothetical protein